MVTKTKIKIIANDIVNTVDKKQALPERKDYNMRTCAWILANFILNPKAEIHARKVKSADFYDGEFTHDKLNKNTYTSLANQLVKHIKNTGKIPSSLKYGNKKIQTKVYIYGFASVVKYYFKHNAFPSKIWFSRTSFNKPTPKQEFKKFGHSTRSGCDNMGQNTDYYCGVHSLQEVIRNLYDIVVPQDTLAEWCGTTSAGTSHDGLETGVAVFNKRYNKNLKVKWYNLSDLGWNGVSDIIDSNNKDCIIHNNYRNQWGHYEVINDVSYNINVQNSLGDYCNNGCHCGYIEYRTQDEFEDYISGISQKSIMVLEG